MSLTVTITCDHPPACFASLSTTGTPRLATARARAAGWHIGKTGDGRQRAYLCPQHNTEPKETQL